LNGVTLIKINRNNGTPLNDQINLPSSAITYGGTLTVNNIGAPLTAGDSFQIFSATNYPGNFAALNFPSLGTGLAWNTNALTNGVLSVIATVPRSSAQRHKPATAIFNSAAPARRA
jgi:hypothetical protein